MDPRYAWPSRTENPGELTVSTYDACASKLVCVCIYIYTYVHICVDTYIYIHIHIYNPRSVYLSVSEAPGLSCSCPGLHTESAPATYARGALGGQLELQPERGLRIPDLPDS